MCNTFDIFRARREWIEVDGDCGQAIVQVFSEPALGNIRELINVIECMSFMSQNETLTVDDLPDGYKLGEAGSCFIPDPGQTSWEPGSLDSAEQHVIESAIMQSGGNMTRAAKHLGIAKSTLYQKIKKYGLEKTG